MANCPSCLSVLPEKSNSCPVCGTSLPNPASDSSELLAVLVEKFTCALREGKAPAVEEYALRYPEIAPQIRKLFPTIAALENAAREENRNGRASGGKDLPVDPLYSNDALAPGRFTAGTILSGRYRIIGLLGKGGMGEVYRAEDLKLAQQVALKFLPERLASDGAALSRFHREVRLARQTSHRNVCRVFDLGEEQGQHFISMEYIDGENLASLLRRIGRLPKDKAVDVARQLCAGLAAAHESDVLHRDLKPGNIMIDGRGKVKITDFGLAVLGEQCSKDVPAGTPAYMAPEQLAQREFTAKSDIYSLGLVLYEIFTGKRVFQAQSLAELQRLHEQTPVIRPSRQVKGMDHRVEHWIMRCLEKNPHSRPSAAEIAAAMSGGSALAAALAAGETPSPEMVAASSEERLLSPAVITACMLGFLVSIFLMVLFSGRGQLHRVVPLEISPEALEDRARTLIMSLGYAEAPVDSTYGFGRHDNYLRYIATNDSSADRWKRLRASRPSVLFFWYRQSPVHLVPTSQGRVTADDPPLVVPNMILILLNTDGHLLEFDAVSSNAGSPADAHDAWRALFDAARLDMDLFKPVVSDFVSPVGSDERATWEGAYPDEPATKIRVDAAAFRGRPVYFRILGPWSDISRRNPEYTPSRRRAGYETGAQSSFFIVFSFAAFVIAVLSCAFFARHNLRIGRGDRQGAFRLALWIFATKLLAWLFQTHHVGALGEMDLFYTALAWALFYAGVSWILYIALEPYIRRRWPYRIISWSRLLAGGFRDPLVGRDIVLGALCGTSSILFGACIYAALPMLGFASERPHSVALNTLLGAGEVLGQILAMQREVLTDPLYVMVVLLLLTLALRREWPAFGAAWLLFSVVAASLFGVRVTATWAAVSVIVAIYLLVLRRYGLLGAIVFQFYNYLLMNCPLTLDFYAWYASGTILTLFIAVSVACYGYYIALAGQPLFRPGFLRE